MRLESIEYVQHEGESRQWQLENLKLGSVNLLVGKNASGKTRTLNIVRGLAGLLSRATTLVFSSGDYRVTFKDEDAGEPTQYELKYHDAKVTHERFVSGGKPVLQRAEGGTGKIFAEKQDEYLEFQTPESELAAVARRDQLQHPFFEPLNQWASSLYHYPFGSDMGQTSFVVVTKNHQTEVNPKDWRQVVGIFRKGENEFHGPFKDSIKAEMEAIGYPLEEIGTGPFTSITFEGPWPTDPVGIYVKESTLQDVTDQNIMSQGMFRALSLIIQTTYCEMAGRPSCILIDDIGEGLDFERSVALIELLMEKARRSSIQLVMATNDRFVMNRVPLETWSLLQRDGGKCRVRNYANSKAAFDEFKFTGMTNFDFFAFDYLSEEQPVGE